ncbi:MAG: hypothetical protein DLM69_00655 [Candidatus Chloroheliales bacterium]|nr:MAG: hypothetical protein DLM69_00655 [Chloroflexota bacterium]
MVADGKGVVGRGGVAREALPEGGTAEGIAGRGETFTTCGPELIPANIVVGRTGRQHGATKQQG